MKILDTNGLDHMVKGKIGTTTVLFITPDIQDEFETWHEQKIPKNVLNIFETEGFDQAAYLQSYKDMLNKYGGRSFYNMGGFGDISILALLKVQEAAHPSHLLPENIEVVSGDTGLGKRIRREFGTATGTFGAAIAVTSPPTFFAGF